MSSIDDYARKQEMLTILKNNIADLHKERIETIDKLIKIEQMILKHENFIDVLEEED